MWKCVCDCGSVVNVRAATLLNGDTKSCGCIKSHGERLVAEMLKKKGVCFIREYSFPDCLNNKGNRLKYDFAILKEQKAVALIEYQGEQHYAPPAKAPWFGEMQRQETDRTKREYCLTHNIPLYEIRFDDSIAERVSEIVDMLHDNTVPSAGDNPAKV